MEKGLLINIQVGEQKSFVSHKVVTTKKTALLSIAS